MTRIAPLEAPFQPEIRAALERMMPAGAAPIALFRTFAHNLPMTRAMHGWGSYELSSALSLSLRDREIVIDRTCARCGCEYEWGVHVAYFATRAGLDEQQIDSLASGGPDDPCWTSTRDRTLIRAVDALHDTAGIPDALWDELVTHFDPAKILDLTMLCGWYHAISFTASTARVPHEEFAARLPATHERMPDQPGDPTMHKITVQYFDPADGDTFETAYRERHVPLVKAVPGLERFTISLPRADGAPFLVAELWFADSDALGAAQKTTEMAAVRADSSTYDVGRRLIFVGSVEEV